MRRITGSAVLAAALLAAASAGAQTPPARLLQWDASRFVSRTVQLGGGTMAIRAYEQVVYVTRPVDATFQVMNVYVPEAYFRSGRVGSFTAATAPIFLPNMVGGYMPARPGTPDARGPGSEGPSAIAVALSRGYVVASPGARGRPTRDASGRYTGKAPAAIVDLKAAVRYLRYNDAAMPGDAERIVSNGTSAGGALSALLGAGGNSPDYEPFLAAIGAAPGRDDIFAVSAYCPITDLDHADAAYEWQLAPVHDFTRMELTKNASGMQRLEVKGTLTEPQVLVSSDLRALYPAYVNGLALRAPDGTALTLDAAGNGSFREYVRSFVLRSAQQALRSGADLSRVPWVTIRDGAVRDIDFDQYLRYAGRMKTPPAFDALDLGSGENQLFGTERVDLQHFTAYGQQHSTVAQATSADPLVVRMMNPLSYIGIPAVRTASHWRIRHGTKDRDTSLAVPVLLATRLQNSGHTVDLALPWDRPHSGDYDLDELFTWIEQVVAAPTSR